MVNDLQLSQSEADLFASAMCGNVVKGVMVSQWKDVITLSEGQLLDATVSCAVKEGMTLTAQNDYKSHIGFEFQITFNLSSPPTFPHSITLSEQPIATDASLAHLAEMHPIAITVSGNGAESTSLSPWWVVDGSIEMILDAKAEEKKPLPMTVLGLLLDYPILFIPIFALVALLAVGALRTKNSMGMDLDIFGDEGDVQPNDTLPEEELDDSTTDEAEVHHEKTVRLKSVMSQFEKNKPAKKPRSNNHPDEISERPVVRRRAAKGKESVEGPITTVKRRRLDNRPIEETPAKKRTTRKRVVTKTAARKTRKVVTKSDKNLEDSPGER
jgi:hypothetical protein